MNPVVFNCELSNMRLIHYLGILLIVLLLAVLVVDAGPYNGFELADGDLIAAGDIHAGGPPRDAIPALDNPVFQSADEADIGPGDQVLGLWYQGQAKAYPVAVMNWHEIVNDAFAGQPVVVTYCPLCGSGVAYRAKVSDTKLSFGVSGLLYNSDVLLYDRQTESLWSQLMSQAVSGPMRGSRLELLPLVHTTWAGWRKQYPDTLLLSRNTGFDRDYDRDPYDGYEDSEGVWFPVKHRDPRYHPKERVLGLELNGRFKAYPLSELGRSKGKLKDRFAGVELLIDYSPQSHSARIFDPAGSQLPAINAYWFAWYAFHPETEVYRAPRLADKDSRQ